MNDSNEKPVVLVVDDIPANIKVLASFLEQDYRVIAATSGERALQIVSAAPPDILLLDIRMPDMDGFAVCEALQAMESARKIPILFVTGESDPEEEAHALASGAVGLIAKPVIPSVVLAHVKRALLSLA
ncbi:MAG: response regulator [Magnetococcus sp. MYC-9]